MKSLVLLEKQQQISFQTALQTLFFSDGPACLNILSEVSFKNGTIQSTPIKVPKKYSWGSFAEFLRKNACSSDGTLVYCYPTCWPCAILFAQTWNQSIVEKAGSGTANEMEKYGISVILGPGMNTHRNPLCGRSFEYFSEDLFVSGTIKWKKSYCLFDALLLQQL